MGWSRQAFARRATERDEDVIVAWKDEQWPIKGRRQAHEEERGLPRHPHRRPVDRPGEEPAQPHAVPTRPDHRLADKTGLDFRPP
ncbi:hypothetical protein ACFQX6_42270 [Streptosporangium lutulentum]